MNDGEVETPQTIRRRKCFLPCCPEEDCNDMKCCKDENDHDDHHGHSHSHGLEMSSVRRSGHGHSHGSSSSQTGSHQNVQHSPTSLPGSSIGGFSGGIIERGSISGREVQATSLSLNNHLDISSLDSVGLSNKDANINNTSSGSGASGSGSQNNNAILRPDEDDSDSDDDDAHEQAELRPMI